MMHPLAASLLDREVQERKGCSVSAGAGSELAIREAAGDFTGEERGR